MQMSKKLALQSPFKRCIGLELFAEDDTPPIRLDIVPTMKSITHAGRTYHRMEAGRTVTNKGDLAMYLWDGWRQWFIANKQAKTL